MAKDDLVPTSMLNPFWFCCFQVVGFVILIPIGLTVRVVTELSAFSDKVFAVEALVAGLLANEFFKRKYHRKLIVSKKISIPFTLLWFCLCIFVFIFEPLKG